MSLPGSSAARLSTSSALLSAASANCDPSSDTLKQPPEENASDPFCVPRSRHELQKDVAGSCVLELLSCLCPILGSCAKAPKRL